MQWPIIQQLTHLEEGKLKKNTMYVCGTKLFSSLILIHVRQCQWRQKGGESESALTNHLTPLQVVYATYLCPVSGCHREFQDLI